MDIIPVFHYIVQCFCVRKDNMGKKIKLLNTPSMFKKNV